MRQELASKLVSDTFTSRFREDKFLHFMANFLNDVQPVQSNILDQNNVPSHFESTIKQYKCLARYEDPAGKTLDILSVNLMREGSVRRAQVMQRNFIAWYLRGYAGRDSALVSFYHEELEDWRFSYVKIFDQLERGVDGIVRTKAFQSPATRFSFLVGENEPSHTAQKLIVPVLMNDQKNPTLTDIEDVFSVEIVTEEFFYKYKGLFENLKNSLEEQKDVNSSISDEFERKNIKTDEFAKKLLGQIVFLYFLQKKGWLGVEKGGQWGSGSKSYLRDLFNRRADKNFFNDFLEPLFYDALRHDRREIDDYYTEFNCKIPFLNGGLFDPINNYDWVNTDILLPDELFSSGSTSPNPLAEVGNGILDVFDRYNFTVKEDEPLEREVAIDPEMLGKVFERLLGSDERKSKGTFYTPRKVVRYMCQESLLNYLYTEFADSIDREDFKLLIKCSEASYGKTDIDLKSGQTEMLPRSIIENAIMIDQKLSLIRVCDPAVGSGAFVVGMMNEIVGIRDTLTHYIENADSVDRDTYSLKREAIQNCLYGVDIDSGAVEIAKLRLWLSLVVDEKDRRSILPLPNLDYKIICGDSLLMVDHQDLFNFDFQELSEKQKLYFHENNPSRKQILKRQIDQLMRAHTGKDFDLTIWFPEIFGGLQKRNGFDVVIGNPPYVQLQKMKDSPARERYEEQQNYVTYTRSGDIYCLFYERGINITRRQGILAYITSNKWMRTAYGKKLREFFNFNNPIQLINLGPNVFETATVDTNIIFVQKSKNNDSLRGIKLDKRIDINIADLIDQESVRISSPSDGPWFIGSPIETTIKRKMDHIGISLKKSGADIHAGIKTGFNDAFLVNETTKNQLIAEDSQSSEILKPILKGHDIKRYDANIDANWLIASHNGYDGESPLDIEQYPAIKKHLDKFYQDIVNRQDQGHTPYNLRSCNFYEEFELDKIVWPDISSNEPAFHLVQDGIHIEASAFMIAASNLKQLLGILNSSVVAFYVPKIATDLGGAGVRYKKQFVEKLPIPKPNEKSSSIEELVEQVLRNKKLGKDTSDLEKEIDFLVYDLYDLESKEISFIESIQ